MPADNVKFLTIEGPETPSRRIAYNSESADSSKRPGLFWLNGYNSVMTSTKVSALADWARGNEVPLLRFDYSGHGQSEGSFRDGTIGLWLEEAIAVLTQIASGPQIIVGSSMGAWIALLILRARACGDRQAGAVPPIAAAILIAPAWDMTEALMWQRFSEAVRRTIEDEGEYLRPSLYGDGPYPVTRKLIEEGRRHLIAGTPFDPGCPVRILQGRDDPDVPWQHASRLKKLLTGKDVKTIYVADGDHRLSRPADIAVLLQLVEGLIENTA